MRWLHSPREMVSTGLSYAVVSKLKNNIGLLVALLLTQLAFYFGWPKARSTFPMIEGIWGED